MPKETCWEIITKSNENIFNYISMNLYINSIEDILAKEFLAD